jgi:PST family polysaccharide transporter
MMFSRDRLRQLLRHEVVKNTALLYIVQMSSYIFPLITLPYLARVLGPSKMGIVAFASSFVWYFQVTTEYGFDLSATRTIAVHRDDPEVISRTFNSVMAAKALLFGLSFVAMVVIVGAVPRFRSDWVLFFASFLAVAGNLLFPLWLYQGLQVLQHVAVRDISAKFLSLVAIFLLIHRESDYVRAAGIQSGALALAGLVGLVMVPRLTRVRFQMPAWGEVTARLREGAPMFVSMAAMTLYGTTNVFILGLVSTSTEVGYYSSAWRIILALRMLVGPVVGALYPHISHMAARSQGDVIRFLRRYSLLLSAPFFLIGVVLLIAAPWIVAIVFGPKYLPTTLLLRIMAFSPFFLAISHSYTSYYMLAFGYDKEWTRMVVMGTVLNFAVLIPLLHFLPGSQALAITTTILDAYILIASYIFYLKTSPGLLRRQEANIQI